MLLKILLGVAMGLVMGFTTKFCHSSVYQMSWKVYSVPMVLFFIPAGIAIVFLA